MLSLKNNRSIFCFIFLAYYSLLALFIYFFPPRNSFLNLFLFSLILSPSFFWSLWEIIRALKTSKGTKLFVYAILVIFLLSVPWVYFLFRYGLSVNIKYQSAIWVSWTAMLALFFLAISFRGRGSDKGYRFNATFKLFTGALLYWSSLFYLVLFKTWEVYIGLTALVFLNDTSAFLIGKYGKLKIFKHSPSKTLEGFLASLFIVCMVMCLISSFWLKHSLTQIAIKTTFGFFLSIAANMGDLYYSQQKRRFGIKDYGAIFGGHGGYWDRFDSHTFALTLASLYVFFEIIINGEGVYSKI